MHETERDLRAARCCDLAIGHVPVGPQRGDDEIEESTLQRGVEGEERGHRNLRGRVDATTT
ncbi:hypothetical protein DB32_007863 [Sandaracinus amylolyticus]|uniref:Uncharacterized protein n=1 Tax=Sandaracinus amylolyticus TaxID=927083 RepID=A0A0F6SHM7_9BACT|nr:hypothetical protein DB32_007863 [Sandaracinus amylolyticus]